MMARRPPAEGNFYLAEIEIGIVVENPKIVWLCFQIRKEGFCAASRFVHPTARDGKGHGDVGDLGASEAVFRPAALFERSVEILCQPLNEPRPNAMARLFVYFSRIAKTKEDGHYWYGIIDFFVLELGIWDLEILSSCAILGKQFASMEERRSSFFTELAKLVLISLLIIVPLRLFIVQPFFVRGASMEPAFEDGDYLLIDEISLRFRPIERGEVVVFRFPPEPSQFYIKRIVGLPGERLSISDGKVRIFTAVHPNGFSLTEPYLAEGTVTGGDVSVSLGPNEYFVLGDNRPHSSDSRRWGKLDGRLITGRAWLRAWPPERAMAFTVPVYQP